MPQYVHSFRKRPRNILLLSREGANDPGETKWREELRNQPFVFTVAANNRGKEHHVTFSAMHFHIYKHNTIHVTYNSQSIIAKASVKSNARTLSV